METNILNPMAKTTKELLPLNQEEVMGFFMKSEQYYFELSKYFTSGVILMSINKKTGTPLYLIYHMGNFNEPIWNNDWIRCQICSESPLHAKNTRDYF